MRNASWGNDFINKTLEEDLSCKYLSTRIRRCLIFFRNNIKMWVPSMNKLTIKTPKQNWPEKGLCVGCLSVWGPLPSQVFVWGGLAICRLWIWWDKECLTPAENDLQHDSTPPTPSQPHTVCIYCTLTQGGGRESWTREKVRGATVHNAGSKIPTWLTVSLVYKPW